MKILHFSDLHLDRSFAGLGMASAEADHRREDLRRTLRRIIDLAIERDVDVVSVGGDLYEHERVTIDTGNFIAAEFRRLGPRRVLISPGNHDPYVPSALYRQVQWPANVSIFDSQAWSRISCGDVDFWGVAHMGPATRENLLSLLHVDPSRQSIALFHGSDTAAVPNDKVMHCPFSEDDVVQSGAALVLLGHYHEMRIVSRRGQPLYAYPGSPEPLDFSEAGAHHILLATLGNPPRVEAIPVNEVNYCTQAIDVSRMTTSDDIRAAIAEIGEMPGMKASIVRVSLTGDASVDLDINPPSLVSACGGTFRYLDIVNASRTAPDLDELAEETTTRGLFVRKMRSQLETTPEPQRQALEDAIYYGLQAFAGRELRQR